jgi:hypothetical protein
MVFSLPCFASFQSAHPLRGGIVYSEILLFNFYIGRGTRKISRLNEIFFLCSNFLGYFRSFIDGRGEMMERMWVLQMIFGGRCPVRAARQTALFVPLVKSKGAVYNIYL